MNHPALSISVVLSPVAAVRRLIAVLSAAIPALVPILLIAGAIAFGAAYLDSDGPDLIAGVPITASDQLDCVVFCEPPAATGHADGSGCVMFCSGHTLSASAVEPAMASMPAAEPPAALTAAGAVLTGFGQL